MNRMERCNNYFHFCESKAAELGVPFRWQLHVVEGTAHEEGGLGHTFGVRVQRVHRVQKVQRVVVSPFER